MKIKIKETASKEGKKINKNKICMERGYEQLTGLKNFEESGDRTRIFRL